MVDVLAGAVQVQVGVGVEHAGDRGTGGVGGRGDSRHHFTGGGIVGDADRLLDVLRGNRVDSREDLSVGRAESSCAIFDGVIDREQAIL